jgi:hypothetical protein
MFAGSVFSPDYAARLRAGEPRCGLDVPAVNVALYERTRGAYPSTQRAWVMNEYARDALSLSLHPGALRIAASSWSFADDGRMMIELDEHTTRFFGRRGPRLRGRISVAAPPPRLLPMCLGTSAHGQAHYWQPIAPRAAATVELSLDDERFAYSGLAYCDRNYGWGRLEDAFSRWGWAHGFSAPDPSEAVIVYRTTPRWGPGRQLSVHYPDPADLPAVVSTDTAPDQAESPPPPEGLWRLRVPEQFAAGGYTCQRLTGGTMEDTPFYSRFAVRIAKAAPATSSFLGVGEFLDLERFRRPQLQYLLQYKTRHAGSGR